MANEEDNPSQNMASNWLEYYRFQPERDSPSDARNTMLVVATLIATVAFQAGINPPGGLWQETKEGHEAGKSILGYNHAAYKLFIIAYMVRGVPMSTEVYIAIFSMTFTYGNSVIAVTRDGAVNLALLAAAIFLPNVLRLIVQCYKK